VNILGVIPARYASSRFPGKPLVQIKGLSMIQRVYEQAIKSSKLSKVTVATDHNKIFNHVKDFGGDVILTEENHSSGTERCIEVLKASRDEFDFLINIQGDEPLIDPRQIDLLAASLNKDVTVGTLAKKIANQEELLNPNVVKVVWNIANRAHYFSRNIIPHLLNVPQNEWLEKFTFFKHIGIYAYRADILARFPALSPSPLEKAESLEQLRWLHHGIAIKVVETDMETIGVDTPDDVKKVEDRL